MNRQPLPNDDSWESDAVWKLLDQAAPKTVGPRFADDTVRAARLASQDGWWRHLLAPLPLGGLAAATAALAIAFVSLRQSPPPQPVGGGVAASEESFADMQELAETEALSAAVDHLDDFTDSELVCLIGL
ncbi:MAG: hypothetical protein RLZZ522_207 [Verrucomicrobiota bacterium]